MARLGRVVVANYPHHVVQRGHNKAVVFGEEADYRYYLSTLEDVKEVYGVKVYGFCLMTNHVHLILHPGESMSGLGQLMKRLAGRQTRLVNRQESRSGTLWEGRYKSSPVETDAYLLAPCVGIVVARWSATPCGRGGCRTLATTPGSATGYMLAWRRKSGGWIPIRVIRLWEARRVDAPSAITSLCAARYPVGSGSSSGERCSGGN
jgi:REP element-mobilizing transposase RayT